jgi:hypothetical protein
MYVGNIEVSGDWVRLGDVLSILTDKTYTLQNISRFADLWVVEKESPPEGSERGFTVVRFALFQYKGNGDLWLRSSTRSVTVSVGD